MKRNRKQIGAYSKRKGATFEREVSLLFSQWTGLPCRRTPMSGAYGHEWGLAGDLMFAGNYRPNIIVELKRREGWNWPHLLNGKGPVFEWWSKLCGECDEDPTNPWPVLIFKKNRGQIWVGVEQTVIPSISSPIDLKGPLSVIIRFPGRHPKRPLTIFPAADILHWVI